MNPNFNRLWAAQALSAVGARITRTALPMLAILTIEASPAEVALLSALSFAPGLLVSLFAGGIVDRRPKRPLMIWADLARAALLLTVPLAAATGSVSMAQLYVVAGLVGAGTTLFGIADNTFLPVIVPRERLVAANSRLEATDSVAEGVGPWIGGVLVGAIGAPLALVVDAASYLWSAALLRTIRAEETVVAGDPGETGAFADARAGLAVCRSDPLVARLLAVATILPFAGGFFFALYMVVVLDELGLGPGLVGLIIGVGGIGGVLGALAAPVLRRRMGVWGGLMLSLIVGKAFDVVVPLSLALPDLAVPLLVSGQLFGDGFMTAFAILALSLRQEVLPERLLGRANATFHLAEGVALVTGSLLAGLLSLWLPTPVVIWGAALGGLAAVPVFWAGRPETRPSG